MQDSCTSTSASFLFSEGNINPLNCVHWKPTLSNIHFNLVLSPCSFGVKSVKSHVQRARGGQRGVKSYKDRRREGFRTCVVLTGCCHWKQMVLVSRRWSQEIARPGVSPPKDQIGSCDSCFICELSHNVVTTVWLYNVIILVMLLLNCFISMSMEIKLLKFTSHFLM